MERKHTRQVMVAGVAMGGDAPVSIQSMCNTNTDDVKVTVAQILALEEAGCEIVRVAVPNEKSAKALSQIKEEIHIPLVADIHFDYRLALLSLEAGVDKLRLNPGNIGGADRVRMVADAAKERHVPIRVGVNGGSMSKEVLRQYGGPTAEAMAESALQSVALLEREGFSDIVVSLKASNVRRTVEASRAFAARSDYPQHIGITEAGSGEDAIVKGSVGLGTLLLEGIGDTMRVSITGDPVQEIAAAKQILRAVGLREEGIEIISCPTCGRAGTDLLVVVEELKQRLPKTDKSLQVAVMGCAVNGPGEAREADLGVAFGPNNAVLFEHGEKIGSVAQGDVVETLLTLIDQRI